MLPKLVGFVALPTIQPQPKLGIHFFRVFLRFGEATRAEPKRVIFYTREVLYTINNVLKETKSGGGSSVLVYQSCKTFYEIL